MDFRVCTWFVSVRSCAVLICDSLFLSVPWYFLFKKFLHFFCRVTRSQILLKNNSSSWKRPFHFSKHFLSHQLIVFFRIHHPCDRIKWSNTLEAETTPKHFLFGDVLLFGWCDLLWSFPHHFSWHGDNADLAPKSDFRRKTKLSSDLLLSILCTFSPMNSFSFAFSQSKVAFIAAFWPFCQLKPAVSQETRWFWLQNIVNLFAGYC